LTKVTRASGRHGRNVEFQDGASGYPSRCAAPRRKSRASRRGGRCRRRRSTGPGVIRTLSRARFGHGLAGRREPDGRHPLLTPLLRWRRGTRMDSDGRVRGRSRPRGSRGATPSTAPLAYAPRGTKPPGSRRGARPSAVVRDVVAPERPPGVGGGPLLRPPDRARSDSRDTTAPQASAGEAVGKTGCGGRI
jgi:hypothetical protein